MMNLNNLNGMLFPTTNTPKLNQIGSILESLSTQERQKVILTSPISTTPVSYTTTNNNNNNNNNKNMFKGFNLSNPLGSFSTTPNNKSSNTKQCNVNKLGKNNAFSNLPPVPPVTGNIGKIVNNNNKNMNKNAADVHYLWQCGIWTSSTQEINNFDSNLLMAPKLAIIEPKTLDNFNKLSNINIPQSSVEPASPSDKCDDTISVHSNNSFSTLSYRPSPSPSPCPSRYSLSSQVSHGSTARSVSYGGNGNTRSNQNHNQFNGRKVGSFKHYVFFSNRLTSVFQRRLGNNGLGLEYQSLYQFEARKFQYSLLRGDIRFVKDYSNINNHNNNNNNNNNGIVRDYLIFKFGRSAEHSQLYAICERNDRQPERQPWCCQHILSLEEMIQYFNVNDLSMDAKLSFLRHLRISDECVKKTFDPKMDYNSNIPKIIRMLQHGFYQFQKDLAMRSNSYGYNRNNNNAKLKNEDKFSYLGAIANNLGLSIESLLDLVGDAIEDSFLFARKFPKSALTQAYIDEERGIISYELVLEAEIFDNIRNKYYKFAVPIVKCQNRQTKAYYYEAKNILTPKMAIDNIRLNSPNASLDTRTWVAHLNNWNNSYYRNVSPMWFENIALARINTNISNTINNNNNNNNTCGINQTFSFTPIITGNINNATNVGNISNIGNIANIGNLTPVGNNFGINLNNLNNFPNCFGNVLGNSLSLSSTHSESDDSIASNDRSRKTPRSQISQDNDEQESEESSRLIIHIPSPTKKDDDDDDKSNAESVTSRSPSPSVDPRGPQFFNFNQTCNKNESEEESDDDDEDSLPPVLGTLRRSSIDSSDEESKNEKSAFEFGNLAL